MVCRDATRGEAAQREITQITNNEVSYSLSNRIKQKHADRKSREGKTLIK